MSALSSGRPTTVGLMRGETGHDPFGFSKLNRPSEPDQSPQGLLGDHARRGRADVVQETRIELQQIEALGDPCSR